MNRDEFARRRRQLMRMMGRESIAILPAAPVRHRNNDVEYPYRQDSDFYYLTGFAEPESVAVLIPGRPQAEYVLFVRDRDAGREVWDGARAGPDGATRSYGANDAFPVTDIDEPVSDEEDETSSPTTPKPEPETDVEETEGDKGDDEEDEDKADDGKGAAPDAGATEAADEGDDDDSGCAVAAAPKSTSSSSAWLLSLVGLAFLRRRRS